MEKTAGKEARMDLGPLSPPALPIDNNTRERDSVEGTRKEKRKRVKAESGTDAMFVMVQGPSVLVAWKDDLRDGTIIPRDPGPKLRRLLHLLVVRRGPLRSCFSSCYQRA